MRATSNFKVSPARRAPTGAAALGQTRKSIVIRELTLERRLTPRNQPFASGRFRATLLANRASYTLSMYADVVFEEEPLWSHRSGRRLALNFLPASIIVLGALAVLRLPVVELSLPMTELIVRILVEETEQLAEQPFVDETPMPVEATPDLTSANAAPIPSPVITEPRDSTDWHALVPEAARAANDARPREYSVNPGFDEKRRVAAQQFAPSQAPVERPIWENVERDTMGRTLLRSGNCYRVINDPNAGSREAFLIFGQFMATCERPSDPPRALPWVSELQNRREGQVRYGHPAVE